MMHLIEQLFFDCYSTASFDWQCARAPRCDVHAIVYNVNIGHFWEYFYCYLFALCFMQIVASDAGNALHNIMHRGCERLMVFCFTEIRFVV